MGMANQWVDKEPFAFAPSKVDEEVEEGFARNTNRIHIAGRNEEKRME